VLTICTDFTDLLRIETCNKGSGNEVVELTIGKGYHHHLKMRQDDVNIR
jgi:hypothetical protein